jgi:hypothetical protein
MSFGFRMSRKILPGVRINIGKKSASVTLGGRGGPHATLSTSGRRTLSQNLPGPFFWRSTSTAAGRRRKEAKRAELQARLDARREAIRRRREGS